MPIPTERDLRSTGGMKMARRLPQQHNRHVYFVGWGPVNICLFGTWATKDPRVLWKGSQISRKNSQFLNSRMLRSHESSTYFLSQDFSPYRKNRWNPVFYKLPASTVLSQLVLFPPSGTLVYSERRRQGGGDRKLSPIGHWAHLCKVYPELEV